MLIISALAKSVEIQRASGEITRTLSKRCHLREVSEPCSVEFERLTLEPTAPDHRFLASCSRNSNNT